MLRSFKLAAAVAAAVALASGAAHAHARLTASSPAAGDTVKTGLTEIALTFNETLEPALSTVELGDAQNKTLVSTKGTQACDGENCKMTVPPLAAGDYTVKYHVLSADGHVVKGAFSFHVAD
jgi:copper resistance protein C